MSAKQNFIRGHRAEKPRYATRGWFSDQCRKRLPAVAVVMLLTVSSSPSAIAAAVVTVLPSPDEGVSDDVFDVSQGTVVTAAWHQQFDSGKFSRASNTFGFTSEFVEPTWTVFKDFLPASDPDFINFTTPKPVDLSGYRLILADGSVSGERGANSFKLFESDDGIDYTLISSTTIANPYTSNYGFNWIEITDTVNVRGKQFFRIELTRATFAGTRVIELDAIGEFVPEPSTLTLAALALITLLAHGHRRRRA